MYSARPRVQLNIRAASIGGNRLLPGRSAPSACCEWVCFQIWSPLKFPNDRAGYHAWFATPPERALPGSWLVLKSGPAWPVRIPVPGFVRFNPTGRAGGSGGGRRILGPVAYADVDSGPNFPTPRFGLQRPRCGSLQPWPGNLPNFGSQGIHIDGGVGARGRDCLR